MVLAGALGLVVVGVAVLVAAMLTRRRGGPAPRKTMVALEKVTATVD